MRRLEATIKNGYTIKLDEEDAHLVEKYDWRAYKNRNTTVITVRTRCGAKEERLCLPRLIAQAQPGQWVWHLNGDPLDVRRGNLKAMHRPTGHKSGRAAEKYQEE